MFPFKLQPTTNNRSLDTNGNLSLITPQIIRTQPVPKSAFNTSTNGGMISRATRTTICQGCEYFK